MKIKRNAFQDNKNKQIMLRENTKVGFGKKMNLPGKQFCPSHRFGEEVGRKAVIFLIFPYLLPKVKKNDKITEDKIGILQ